MSVSANTDIFYHKLTISCRIPTAVSTVSTFLTTILRLPFCSRKLAKRLGVEKVFLKAGRMTLFFISNQESPYYQSAAFGKVIDYMSKNPRYCNLREQNGKRSKIVKI